MYIIRRVYDRTPSGRKGAMRVAVQVFSALAVLFLAGSVPAARAEIRFTADGAYVGAVCIFDEEAGFEKKLKLKSGEVVDCEYDCFTMEGGAICRSEPCEFIVCNDPSGSWCSNPDGPDPGKLRTTTSGGICDNTGEHTGVPGDCYYPEVIIDCGSKEACVVLGHGRDFCRFIPKKKGK
jgi:hypothetical protein